MHRITPALSWAFATALVLVNTICVAAADNVFPQQVNISLVFPRNETYDASSGTLPVIFAFTNPAYAVLLRPLVGLRIFSGENISKSGTLDRGVLELRNPVNNYDGPGDASYSGDLVFLHHPTLNLIGREGVFSLRYSIDITTGVPPNGTPPDGSGSGITPRTISSYGSLVYTMKKGVGASLSDLVVGTANTSCANVPLSWSLAVTNMLNRSCDGSKDLQLPIFPDTCAFLANDTQIVVADYDGSPPFVNITTTGSDCAPTMDTAAAAAVESTVAALACSAAVPSTTPCGTNSTDVPHSGITPISVPGVAAIMAVVMGVATGALLL